MGVYFTDKTVKNLITETYEDLRFQSNSRFYQAVNFEMNMLVTPNYYEFRALILLDFRAEKCLACFSPPIQKFFNKFKAYLISKKQNA